MPEITAAQWWQPQNPSDIRSGVLFEDENGWVLELDSAFAGTGLLSPVKGIVRVTLSTLLPYFPILLGSTSHGKYITLFECQVINANLAIGQSRGPLKCRPTMIAHDIHFTSAEDFRLTSLSIRYSSLDSWVATSGFETKLAPNFYPVSVTYSRPEPIKTVLPKGLVASVEFWVSGPTLPTATEAHITQRSWLTIESEASKPFEELQLAAINFSNFVSLGVGQTLRPLAMNATCNAIPSGGSEPQKTNLSLIDNRRPIAAGSRDVDGREMLFTLPDIRSRLETMLCQWFGRDERLQSLYDLYFGTIRSSSIYLGGHPKPAMCGHLKTGQWNS